MAAAEQKLEVAVARPLFSWILLYPAINTKAET